MLSVQARLSKINEADSIGLARVSVRSVID
jgi:hypothetical protein